VVDTGVLCVSVTDPVETMDVLKKII
jgi:hypothetical protein